MIVCNTEYYWQALVWRIALNLIALKPSGRFIICISGSNER